MQHPKQIDIYIVLVAKYYKTTDRPTYVPLIMGGNAALYVAERYNINTSALGAVSGKPLGP